VRAAFVGRELPLANTQEKSMVAMSEPQTTSNLLMVGRRDGDTGFLNRNNIFLIS
jgi:hypothetical protein